MKRKIKPLLICNSDVKGGAALAAYRLHKSLRARSIDSYMKVRHKYSEDKYVIGPISILEKLVNRIRSPLGQVLGKFQITDNKNYHSFNIIPSRWSEYINKSGFDVINIHWVGAETMSIVDIGKIDKPIVMTLHDMWAFCGAEHVVEESEYKRFIEGYSRSNRSKSSSWIDWDKIVWERKKSNWKKNMHIVTPSKWLAEHVKKSAILAGSRVTVIPNIVNLDVFRPLDKEDCKRAIGISQRKKIIMFGAVNSIHNPNKGYDLLVEALQKLSSMVEVDNVQCVIFGSSKPAVSIDIPFTTKWLGHIDSEIKLAEIYNCADVMVIPSRVENLPQTATEAQSCGVPVVAFNSTGLGDAVLNGVTGLLANPYCTNDLAESIHKLIEDVEYNSKLSIASRIRAEKIWNKNVILEKYQNVFINAMVK
ncbi:glycosyltransferase [Vibrio splendidus]